MKKNPKTTALWEAYRADPKQLGKLMEAYSDLVKSTALSVSRQLPKHIELDDLISEGYFGLADAISKFDDSFGYKFETYASFRIRGAIFDQLRGADWAPRSLRSKAKEVELASSKLSSALNREPTTEEIANLLDWDVEEVHSITGKAFSASFSNLDDLVNVNGTKFSLSEVLPDKESSPTTDFSKLQEKIISVIGQLSQQNATVLALYYVQELSLKDIGELMGVTESRACQIHTDALEDLWLGCLPD